MQSRVRCLVRGINLPRQQERALDKEVQESGNIPRIRDPRQPTASGGQPVAYLQLSSRMRTRRTGACRNWFREQDTVDGDEEVVAEVEVDVEMVIEMEMEVGSKRLGFGAGAGAKVYSKWDLGVHHPPSA